VVDVLEVRADGTPVGIDGVDPFAHGASPAAVADDDGDCRPGVDGVYAIGVDEP
jgi:hypothetical protein